MASLPYVTSPGNIDKALSNIKAAAVPERVSQDFVKTILKIPGGSGAQMTTFLKKVGLAHNDGSPSELYKKFRNPASSGSAIAAALKLAYAPLYVRNEFAHELNDVELTGLVVEETGQAHDSNPVKMIVWSFKHLKSFASFTESATPIQLAVASKAHNDNPPHGDTSGKGGFGNLGLNLGYTINLNLPATSDAAVFDAIFRSLKEHLLSNKDG